MPSHPLKPETPDQDKQEPVSCHLFPQNGGIQGLHSSEWYLVSSQAQCISPRARPSDELGILGRGRRGPVDG